jgi:hypothetical protein
MTEKHFYALIGFAFVVAWISLNFGYAILCLVGAAAFYAAGSFVKGDLDLSDLQQRLRRETGAPQYPAPAQRPVVRRRRVH